MSDCSSDENSSDEEETISLDALVGFKFNVDDQVKVIIHHEKVPKAGLLPIKKRIGEFDGTEEPNIDLPKWLYDNISTGKAPAQTNRIGFYLESCDPKLSNLPSQSNRLTAHRILRIKKIAAHIVKSASIQIPSRAEFEKQKLDYEKKKNIQAGDHVVRESDVTPDEYLEILCNDRVLDPLHNLGIANTFYRDPSSSVVKMTYRRRYPV